MSKYLIVMIILMTVAGCVPKAQPTLDAQTHQKELNTLHQAYTVGGWPNWLDAAEKIGLTYTNVSYLGSVTSGSRVVGMQANWTDLKVIWPSCFTTDQTVLFARSIDAGGGSWIHTNNPFAFNGKATVFPSCRDELRLAP